MRKTLQALCTVAALAIAIAGCNQTPPDTHDADVKAIRDFETQWNADWAAKDADRIAARYSDDAVLMVSGGEAIKGKDAIHNSLKMMTSDPALDLKFQPGVVDVAKSGDLGFTQGAYTLTLTDPATRKVVHDRGNYVTVYRKGADGLWKAVSDIACSSVPPPAPSAATGKKKP